MVTTASPVFAPGRREIRTFRTRLSARDGVGPAFTVSGYASVTQEPYFMGSYSEQIAPGSFAGTLSKNTRRSAAGQP